jgi:hypothetical protein
MSAKESRVQPVAEQMELPSEYGTPRMLLAWTDVRARLEEATNYWLATPRPGGRPHVVPLDGLWLEDAWYFGGSPETVHMRNASRAPSAVMHAGEPLSPIIVEGTIDEVTPSPEDAQRLADAQNTKYAGYGMNATADTYLQGGVFALRADRVLAWTDLAQNATRFLFGDVQARTPGPE